MTAVTSLYIAAGLFFMVLLGYFFTTLISPRGFPQQLSWTFAPGIGAGICSIIFFFFRRPLFTVEFTLLLIFFLAWLRKRRVNPQPKTISTLRLPVLALIFSAILGWVTALCVVWVHKLPHGDWDGWVIWNSHARYLNRAGAVWPEHIKHTFHPDYPLLIPAARARLWRYYGSDLPDAAGLLSALLALSGVFVIAGTLYYLRGLRIGAIMGLVLIGTPGYWALAMSQYADVPLSLYFLMTIAFVAFSWQRTPAEPRFLVLAGFAAGCAAWTKNEGLVFALVTSIVMLTLLVRQQKQTVSQLGMYFLGLLGPLITCLYFKIAVYSPSEYTFNRNMQEVLSKVSDSHRYTTILKSFITTAWSFGNWTLHPFVPLLALLLALGVDRQIFRSKGWLGGFVVVALMVIAYFAVYVLTPYELRDHLGSSLNRLCMQLWPAVVLLLGLAMKRPKVSAPEDRVLPAEGQPG